MKYEAGEAEMAPRKVRRRRHLNPKTKKALTPSKKTQERAEWALAGLITILGTIVAIEVLAAIAAVMM